MPVPTKLVPPTKSLAPFVAVLASGTMFRAKNNAALLALNSRLTSSLFPVSRGFEVKIACDSRGVVPGKTPWKGNYSLHNSYPAELFLRLVSQLNTYEFFDG